MALGALDYLDADDLLSRFDLREYVQAVCGGQWRKTGRAVQGLNPLDPADTKPSFTVYADGYKEFGAGGEHGSAIDFVMCLHGLEYIPALHHIAEFLGGVPMLHTLPQPVERRRIEHSAPGGNWQSVAAAEIERAQAYLFSDVPDARIVLSYLYNVRNLTYETIRAAGLGYNPAWRKTEYIKPDGKAASMPPGILIPWRVDGELWTIRVRCRVGNLAEALGIDPDMNRDGQPLDKYLSFSGSRQAGALYVTGQLLAARDTLITEGEFDALLAAQELGDTANVVTLGSASNRLTDGWCERLSASSRVLLVLDSDGAGQAARDKLIVSLSGRVPLRTLQIPQGKDITDHVAVYGGAVAELIAAAQPVEVPSPSLTPLPDSVPDTWRAALNKYAYPAIAPTFELWCEAIRAGLIDRTEAVTVGDLLAAAEALGRHTSETTIRRGLDYGAGGFFAILHPSYLTEGNEISIGKTAKNLGGRPKTAYQLLDQDAMIAAILAWAAPRIFEEHFPDDDPAVAPIRPAILAALPTDGDAEALAAELNTAYAEQIAAQPEHTARLDRARLAYKRLAKNLKNPKSLPLPTGWTYRNAAEYVACFARASIEVQDGQQTAKRRLAEQIGTSPRTIDALMQRAGIGKTEQFAERQLGTLAELDTVQEAYDPALQGKPKYVVVKGTEYSFSDPAARQHIQRSGQPFTVKYQQANRYSLASELQPARKERRAPALKNEEFSEFSDAQKTGMDAPSGASREIPRIPMPPNRPQVKPPHYFGLDHNPVWAEGWAVKLLHLVTPWTRRGEVLSNRETGERLDYSPRVVIELLRGRDVSLFLEENFPSSEISPHRESSTQLDLLGFALTIPNLPDDKLVSAWASLSVPSRLAVDNLLDEAQLDRLVDLAYRVRECVMERQHQGSRRSG